MSDTIQPAGYRKEFLMFGTLGVPELLLILAIVVVLFGANRLPQLGKGIGSAIRNFKEGMNEGKDGPTEPHNS